MIAIIIFGHHDENYCNHMWSSPIQSLSSKLHFIRDRDFTNIISTTGSNGDAFKNTEKEVVYFDPKIIIYNRVQKCGSRTILQAVRPILEFNKVAFEAKELKFYLTEEEQTQFKHDIGIVMISRKPTGGPDVSEFLRLS